MTSVLLLCLAAAFGYLAADRWIAITRASGVTRPDDERLMLVSVVAVAAVTVLVAGP